MIESIQITDFRGIESGMVQGLRQFNLLVGPNNSGKSAVLEALYLGCAMRGHATRSAENGGAEVGIWNHGAKDFFGAESVSRVLERHKHRSPRDLTYYQKGDARWILGGEMPAPPHNLLYDVSRTLEYIPADFFSSMLNRVPGWSQKIARRFGRILGVGHPFNVVFTPVPEDKQWVQGWIAPEDRVALTIDSYGDGARTAFKVLTPLVALAEMVRQDAPGLFCWEEPELFQNPQTLARLLHEVADLAHGKALQIVIATQSLEVVAHLDNLVRQKVIPKEDLAIIRTNLEQGKLSTSVFSADDMETWTDMKLDVRVPSGEVDSPLVYQLRGRDDDASND